jgi:hypothetical protein
LLDNSGAALSDAAIKNANIAVNGSGQLTGIGTGVNTVVDNSKVVVAYGTSAVTGFGALAAKSAVASTDISVASLSSISPTIGTLRTATTGQRVEITDNNISVYDASNVLRVRMGVW